VGYTAELLTATVTQPTTYAMSYGNPRPAAWAEIANVSAPYRLTIQLAGGNSGGLSVFDSTWGTPTALFGAPLSPVMHPPRALMIDGVGAQAAPLQLTSPTPLVSWTSPSSGSPNSYVVRARELYVDPTTMTTRTRAGGSILTTGTSVRLPPNFLRAGTTCALTVEAYRDSAPYNPSSAPHYFGSAGASAGAMSSQFSVP
jgi:hypothetical protein